MENGHPQAGVDYPRAFADLRTLFPDEQACLDFLARLRWPDGFVCPACGSVEFWRAGAGRWWKCRTCGRRTSVTAGTIFDKTRMPMLTWFSAVWFVVSQKNGVSALGLQRVLGFGSYETAWAWMQKLRRAMVRPERDLLGGPGIVVELDETFVGGRSHGKPGGGSSKVPVMVALEKRGRKLGRLRLGLAPRPGSLDLIDFAVDVIKPGSIIHTDGARMFTRLTHMGYHLEQTVSIRTDDPTEVLPGVHIVASLLKRWLAGTMQHAVSIEQLPYYLDEYVFRFNRRNSRSRGLLFYRLLEQAVRTEPWPLADLVSG